MQIAVLILPWTFSIKIMHQNPKCSLEKRIFSRFEAGAEIEQRVQRPISESKCCAW